MWLGKIIGFLLGLKGGGILGALFGLLLGHIFDKWWQYRRYGLLGMMGGVNNRHAHELFTTTLFQVMGYIAKIDGRVTEAELQAARQIMQRLHLNESQSLIAMRAFNNGKEATFNIDSALTELLRLSRDNRLLIRVFLDIQLQAAQLSGALSEKKQQALMHLFQRLGYIPLSFYFQQFAQQQRQSGYYQQQAFRAPPEPNKLAQAFYVLGVPETATNAEIKRAYRQLMSKHHPDKLMSQGLSEAMLKMATEKAQEIQLAYDLIRQHRGF